MTDVQFHILYTCVLLFVKWSHTSGGWNSLTRMIQTCGGQSIYLSITPTGQDRAPIPHKSSCFEWVGAVFVSTFSPTHLPVQQIGLALPHKVADPWTVIAVRCRRRMVCCLTLCEWLRFLASPLSVFNLCSWWTLHSATPLALRSSTTKETKEEMLYLPCLVLQQRVL